MYCSCLSPYLNVWKRFVWIQRSVCVKYLFNKNIVEQMVFNFGSVRRCVAVAGWFMNTQKRSVQIISKCECIKMICTFMQLLSYSSVCGWKHFTQDSIIGVNPKFTVTNQTYKYKWNPQVTSSFVPHFAIDILFQSPIRIIALFPNGEYEGRPF